MSKNTSASYLNFFSASTMLHMKKKHCIFLCHKLNIPLERLETINFVIQSLYIAAAVVTSTKHTKKKRDETWQREKNDNKASNGKKKKTKSPIVHIK